MLAPWKKSYGKRLKAEEEGDDRGWDGWMASLTWWTSVWGSSGSWWWTGRPGVLQSMGSQRVRHYWVTELNWINKNDVSVETSFASLLLWVRVNSIRATTSKGSLFLQNYKKGPILRRCITEGSLSGWMQNLLKFSSYPCPINPVPLWDPQPATLMMIIKELDVSGSRWEYLRGALDDKRGCSIQVRAGPAT